MHAGEKDSLSNILSFSQDDFALSVFIVWHLCVVLCSLYSLILHSPKQSRAVTVTCLIHITSIATLCLTG